MPVELGRRTKQLVKRGRIAGPKERIKRIQKINRRRATPGGGTMGSAVRNEKLKRDLISEVTGSSFRRKK
jgi:hypothetical protein